MVGGQSPADAIAGYPIVRLLEVVRSSGGVARPVGDCSIVKRQTPAHDPGNDVLKGGKLQSQRFAAPAAAPVL